MQWVKISQRLPTLNTTILIEYFTGDYERKTYLGPEDWWKRNVNAWLDTEEPSFSIIDMKDAYNSGANNWYSFEGFMKKYFNIDIN